jgi:hypothetical protein
MGVDEVDSDYELVVVAVRVTPARYAPPIRIPLEHGRYCRTLGNESLDSGLQDEEIRHLREEHV